MIKPLVSDIGRGVVYIPGHAKGNAGHLDCESGVITSFNEHSVFVRYGGDRSSKATSREDLIWEHEKP